MSTDDLVQLNEWWRERAQRLANETGEPWYVLMGGFRHSGQGSDTASNLHMPHAVPASQSTSQERSQATEEFKPQCQPQGSGLNAE